MTPAPRISIIVPVLNEAKRIVPFLKSLQKFRAQGAEVIVVDGGSIDETVRHAGGLADIARSARQGRGSQMNAGASLAGGRILLFLHADTDLPPAALELIEGAWAWRWKDWIDRRFMKQYKIVHGES